jgi:two-component system chemotaxis response regulator CheY
MKSLIVDDEATNRLLLEEMLKSYGPTGSVINGKEAVEAVKAAREIGEPFDLVCLDIMMPEMNGQEALKAIRADEEKIGIMVGDGVKIIMVTALDDGKNVLAGFREACDAYIVKPIKRAKLAEELRTLNLIPNE